MSYLRFMVPGVISVAIMFWSYFENTYASFVRMYYQKTFDAMMATPLLVEDVIVGELLWGATKSVCRRRRSCWACSAPSGSSSGPRPSSWCRWRSSAACSSPRWA